jgi:hypothetical protein
MGPDIFHPQVVEEIVTGTDVFGTETFLNSWIK